MLNCVHLQTDTIFVIVIDIVFDIEAPLILESEKVRELPNLFDTANIFEDVIYLKMSDV